MDSFAVRRDELKPADIRYFLAVLFKKKRLIRDIFIILFSTVVLVAFLVPPTYEAKSTLLVKFGREYIYHPEIGDKSPAVSINQEETVNSEISILTSTDLIEKVIATLGIEKIYPALANTSGPGDSRRDAAVMAFQEHLKAQGAKKSNVIEVKFRHSDPYLAAEAVNLLLELYTEKHLQLFGGPNSSFYDSQLKIYNKRLHDSEMQLKRFKEKNRLLSMDQERNLLLDQRIRLDSLHKSTLSSIEEEKMRLASLSGRIGRMTDQGDRYTHSERDRIIVEGKSQLLTLQLLEQKLLEKYESGNRQVRDVRAQEQVVNNYLNEQETEIHRKVKMGDPVYQDAEKEMVKAEAALHSLQAREHVVRRQLSQVDATLRRLDANELDLQSLKRNVALNEKNYQVYAEKHEAARIAANMNERKLANVAVIQKAAPPAKPAKPSRALNIGLGFFLASISAIGAALVSEFAGQGYLTPGNVEKDLGLPVLVSIPLKLRE